MNIAHPRGVSRISAKMMLRDFNQCAIPRIKLRNFKLRKILAHDIFKCKICLPPTFLIWHLINKANITQVSKY